MSGGGERETLATGGGAGIRLQYINSEGELYTVSRAEDVSRESSLARAISEMELSREAGRKFTRERKREKADGDGRVVWI